MRDLFHKTITAGGVSYVFRLPAPRDIVRIDNLAHKERGGNDDLTEMGFAYSQSIALLNTLCEDPPGTDFGNMPIHITDKLTADVSRWVRDFPATWEATVEAAARERAREPDFVYSLLWGVPANDSRIQSMSAFQLDLEVRAYFETRRILTGQSAPGPSARFLDSFRERYAGALEGRETEAVTAEELGWTKRS